MATATGPSPVAHHEGEPEVEPSSIDTFPASHQVTSVSVAAAAAVTAAAENSELAALRRCDTDLDKYLFLRNLRDRNEPLFFGLLIDHAEEMLPYVYTPTVGEACEKYSHLPISIHGLFLSPADRGRVLQRLRDCPFSAGAGAAGVRVIVVTDGERILGLGDQGYGGMGISEGKILLYTVMAGVPPQQCLPVCLDVGTNNRERLADPQYKGLRHERVRGADYDALVEEFMASVRQWQPHCLVQFEDFGNANAFRLLHTFRPLQPCFNDDIQGTACIVLTGILSALRVTGGNLRDQRVLFMGAGEAGTGIGELIAQAVQEASGGTKSIEQAREICSYIDSKGLVCKARAAQLQAHKLPFAHDVPFQPDLLSAIKELRPTALVGVSTQTGAFNAEVLKAMAELNAHPIVFPLSNPTSKSECTFEEAHRYTGGRVVFASGSPFPPLTGGDGVTLFPAQANNAYHVFGPIGMAALLTHCRAITDGVFLEAAQVLAELTPQSRLASGMLFPTFSDMKEVSPKLIAAIANYMVAKGIGSMPEEVRAGEPWQAYVQSKMFTPSHFSSL